MSCLSVTLSTTNTTLTGLGSNPGLRDDTPSTDRLSHGRHYPHFCTDSHFCVFHCLPFCAEYTNKTPIPVAQRSKARSLGHGCVVYCQAEICATGRSFVERSFTEYCVTVCDLDTSRMRQSWPAMGFRAARGGGERGRREQEEEPFEPRGNQNFLKAACCYKKGRIDRE